MDKYIDVKELSKRLSINVKTLYDWAREGKIPSHKIRGLLRFKESEIEELMEKGRQDPASKKKQLQKISQDALTKL